MCKVWCLINVKTFLRVYSDIVSLLAQEKGWRAQGRESS